eukprot:scaffold32640_cov63-Phaeocystis_antarctica.AAC.1
MAKEGVQHGGRGAAWQGAPQRGKGGAVSHLRLEVVLLLGGLLELRLQRGQLVLHLLERRLLGREQRGDLGELGLGPRELRALGRDELGDAVVDLHRAHPAAEAVGGLGGLRDLVRLEVLVGDVLLDLLDDGGLHVVLVVVDQRVEELGVVHHLLGGLPEVVHLALAVGRRDLDGRHLLHDADGLHGELDARGRRLHHLDLRDVVLLQDGERLDGRLERGDGLGQPRLALLLDLLGLIGLDVRRRRLLLDDGARLARLLRVAVDDDHQLLRVLLGHDELGLQLGELLLHARDALGRVVELLQADVVAALGRRDLGALDVEQRAEGAEQLEVRRGRHVVVALGLLQVGRRERGDRLLEVAHHLQDGLAHDVLHRDVLQEALGHGDERVPGPRREPVDGAAVDERGELAQPRAEGLADRRHAQHHVQVGAALRREEAPHGGGRRVGHAELLGLGAEALDDRGHLVAREEVGHLARVEDVRDVLHHALRLHLRVGEAEDRRVARLARQPEQPLQVVLPRGAVVVLAQLDLEHGEVRHVRRERRERLAARAADASEQRVAEGLLDDAQHAADVLDGEGEDDELHRLLGHGVVVLEHRRRLVDELVHVWDDHVLRALAVHEVTEEQTLVLRPDHLDPALLEAVLELPLELRVEPVDVGRVDEPVGEDAQALVSPEAEQLVRGLDGLLRRLHDALEDLGDVAQVEGVVALGGRGQQLGRDVLVDVDRGLDHGVARALDLAGELVQVEVEDGREDLLQRAVLVVDAPHHVVVPQVAWRHRVAPAAGRAHGRDELQVDQLAEGALLQVVPAVVVHPLAQQLDGRLRAVLLEHGHVEVVDEDDALLAKGRAEDALPPLVELAVDDALRDGARGLRRVVEEDALVDLDVEREQPVAREQRLARARVAADEHGDAVLHEAVEEVAVLHRVGGLHVDVGELGAGGHLVGGHRRQPLDPRAAVRDEAAVVDQPLVGRRLGELERGGAVGLRRAGRREDLGHLLAQQRAQEEVELCARGLVDRRADGPDEAEDEEALQHVLAAPRVGRLRVALGVLEPQVHVRREHAHERARQLDLLRRHGALALAPHVPQARVEQPLEVLDQPRLLDLAHPRRQRHQPRAHERLPAELGRLHVDHAAARDGGGRGDSEVHALEDQVHARRHGDDLARHEAELLVVVEHRVHVLDPHRVDRPVEDHPPPLDRLVLRALPVDDREDAVGPLVAHRVELAVEPAGRHRLGVEARVAHLDVALHLLLGEQRERGGEGAVVGGLTREGQPDDHEAVAHEEHLVDLEHLGDEGGHLLQPLLVEDGLHRAPEQVVVGGRQVDAREEVGRDAVEERHVGREELGQVDVGDGAQHQDGLVLVGELLLEVACRGEHRLDGAHAVVVVVLARELLRAQLVRLHDLARERPRVAEAVAHQRDLADHRVVGHHHRARAEERLEVVGQLGAAGVARVHRDEDGVGRVDGQVRPLEHEVLDARRDGALDGEDLLRHDREHLEVDPVELVEARPRARRGEPLEELAHGDVIEAVGAVEDDALLGERLGEVLGRLGLARAGGALGRAAEHELDGAHERAVAAVGERRDDEPEGVAEVLVAVLGGGRDHLDEDVARLRAVAQLGVGLAAGALGVIVDAQLRDPVEVDRRLDAGLDHHGEHVAPVHVEGDHRAERRAVELRQVAPAHELHHVVELLRALGLVLLEALEPAVERRLRLARPEDLVDDEHHHAGPVDGPLRAVLARVVGVRLVHLVGDGLLHGELHLEHPLLHHAVGERGVDGHLEGHRLLLDGDHALDDLVLVEVERVDALEALLQVRLHAQRVLGLREDLQQLVVGEEEEPREREPLLLEVVVEPLLDELEQPVGLLEGLEQTLGRRGRQHVGPLGGGGHDLAPQPVDLREALRLRRHLPHDVLGREDGLEVEPDALALEPLVDDLLHRDELGLPLLHAQLEGLDEGRAAHRLRLDDVVVEERLDLVEPAQDEGARIAVYHAVEVDRLPLAQHLVERLLERHLLGGDVRLLVDRLELVAHL